MSRRRHLSIEPIHTGYAPPRTVLPAKPPLQDHHYIQDLSQALGSPNTKSCTALPSAPPEHKITTLKKRFQDIITANNVDVASMSTGATGRQVWNLVS